MLPSQLWRFTGFYGHPEGHRHRQSWALLNRLNGMDQLPWLCMGDFNEILSVDEHVGEVPGMYGRMEDFNEVVNRCGLLDMGFRGVPFTWDNRRTGEGFVQKRLDRALAIASWLECFNLSSVSHILCSHSDHVPLLLQMDVSSSCHHPKRRPQKFEEKWVFHPKCEVIVKEVWADDALQRSPMYIVCEKIKMCCERLFNWYKGISREFHGLIRDKTQSLVHLVEDNVSSVNNSAIAATKSEINRLLLSEELHWRQRSRMTWLAAGDCNTKFFHNHAQQ